MGKNFTALPLDRLGEDRPEAGPHRPVAERRQRHRGREQLAPALGHRGVHVSAQLGELVSVGPGPVTESGVYQVVDLPAAFANQSLTIRVVRFAGSFTQEDGYYTNDKDTATFPNSPLYQALGVFLPLITTNCAILGVALFQTNK